MPPGAEHGPYAAAPGEGTPTPLASVRIGFTEDLGPFLIDPEGMTLYLFTEDTTAGESACYDDCATAWPPVPAGDMLTLPPGIPGTLAETERTDGTTQLTYNDIPLYLYAADTAPGDTNGQDVGEVWYIVPPGMQFGDEPHHGDRGSGGGGDGGRHAGFRLRASSRRTGRLCLLRSPRLHGLRAASARWRGPIVQPAGVLNHPFWHGNCGDRLGEGDSLTRFRPPPD